MSKSLANLELLKAKKPKNIISPENEQLKGK